MRFGVSPRDLVEGPTSVAVGMSDGVRESFDLVIGADGARSGVRELAFPPGDIRIVHLGCHTAAYVIAGVPPGVTPDSFTSMTLPGLTVAIYPIRGNRTAAFFAHRADSPIERRGDVDACKRELEAVYRGRSAIADLLLDRFPTDGDVYFDDVFQVEVGRWSRERIVPLGDAGGCMSLVAGQGASMAVAGRWIVADEWRRGVDPVSSTLQR